MITVTVTTCKRLSLFLETVTSLKACVEGLDDYGVEWLIVDDNSSTSDREKMVQVCPNARFIMKSPVQAGHAHSMNLILKNVKTKYVLHIEDDWQFLKKASIAHMLDVLHAEPKCGQVLFNRDYLELPEEEGRYSSLAECKTTPNGKPYCVHVHSSGDSCCGYWPHFSLRPGLWDMDRIRQVGWFDSTAEHFELEFADRYHNAHGLITCFLPGVTCRHIGKLTTDHTGVNAYVLNNMPQFTATRRKSEIDPWVINLKRRPDRLARFLEASKLSIWPVQVFVAVDGQSHVLTPQEATWFEGNDYGFAQGMVGAALSHLALLTQHANRVDDTQNMVIFEDDCIFPNGCQALDETMLLCSKLLDANVYDYIFMTTLAYAPEVGKGYVTVRKMPQHPRMYTRGGLAAYMISKTGAARLLTFLEKRKLVHCIDTMMLVASEEELSVGVVFPCQSVCYVPVPLEDTTDTDVQSIRTPIKIAHQ